MSKPITVAEALRLIELAREVDGKATKAPWFLSTRGFDGFSGVPGERIDRHIFFTGWNACSRDQESQSNAAAIALWRASYGALLEYLRGIIEFEGEVHQVLDDEHCGFMLTALAPLVTWADAHYPNWRSPR